MSRVFFAIVATVATLALAESLICNKCAFNLLGKCVGQNNETCATNSSVCYTARATFPSLPDFVGFNLQGCRDNTTGCNTITPSTILGVTYNDNVTCCSTNNCNPITLTSSAPSTKMTLTSAVGGAILVSVWGSRF